MGLHNLVESPKVVDWLSKIKQQNYCPVDTLKKEIEEIAELVVSVFGFDAILFAVCEDGGVAEIWVKSWE